MITSIGWNVVGDDVKLDNGTVGDNIDWGLVTLAELDVDTDEDAMEDDKTAWSVVT